MNSAEPIEPHFFKDPCDQASPDETWRAQVASRVTSYRARNHSGGEIAPELNFSPVAEPQNFVASTIVSQNREAQSRILAQSGATQSSAPPVHKAFDTNYYRRLNAESRAQSASMIMSTGAATAAARELPNPELEAEFEAERGAGMRDPLSVEAGSDLALDLELRPGVPEEDVAEDADQNSFLERYCISELPLEPDFSAIQLPLQPEPVPASPQGNLIVFRRPFLEPPLLPQPSRDELAEPVNRRPRILEVPEDILPSVQGSLFPEIRLDADEQEETSNYREPKFEVPLHVARVSERIMASFTDIGVVLAASLLFAAIAWQAMPEVPHTKPFFMMMGAVTLLLWALYQHLFLLYAGRTPGMCMCGIRLRTFDGRMPHWKQRSSRARFMFISFASVALGFLWALVDEDELCWHDRISKTFLTTE